MSEKPRCPGLHGQECERAAGEGTVHPGRGFCRWHGGTIREPPRFLAKTNRGVPMVRRGFDLNISRDEAQGYTSRHSMKMPSEPEPVPRETQERITAEAKRKAAMARAEDVDKRVEDVKAQVRSFTEQLREVAVSMAKDGADPSAMFGEMRQSMERRRRR